MSNIRTMVRGAYDIQKLRIQMGNRIVGNFKAKLGQEPSKSESTLDEKSQKLLEKIRNANKLVTTGAITELGGVSPIDPTPDGKEKKLVGLISELIKNEYDAMVVDKFPSKLKFKGNEVISDYTELCLIAQYHDLEAEEARHFRRMGAILLDYPIYTEFLKDVRGIGPAMAGVIISEIDITKCKYPSSVWAYAGLDVAPDGKGRSRRKEHLVEREYINKKGELDKRVGITFNPFLKSKLMGVLSGSFLRSNNETYVKVYKDYKNRLENHVVYGLPDVSKGHRHNMALRYMIKIFLQDLYNVWRPLEGLEVAPTYQEAKLGYVHATG